MATFQDDIDADLGEIFATDGSGYARAGTFRRQDTQAQTAVDIYTLELVYSPFDPRNQVKFFLRANQLPGGYIPQPNDEVDDTAGTGETFTILNVMLEENLFSVLAQRMDVRQ